MQKHAIWFRLTEKKAFFPDFFPQKPCKTHTKYALCVAHIFGIDLARTASYPGNEVLRRIAESAKADGVDDRMVAYSRVACAAFWVYNSLESVCPSSIVAFLTFVFHPASCPKGNAACWTRRPGSSPRPTGSTWRSGTRGTLSCRRAVLSVLSRTKYNLWPSFRGFAYLSRMKEPARTGSVRKSGSRRIFARNPRIRRACRVGLCRIQIRQKPGMDPGSRYVSRIRTTSADVVAKVRLSIVEPERSENERNFRDQGLCLV